MKKITLLLTLVLATLSASATIAVCDVEPDESGHFDCPFIKSGTITWDESTRTLTLDNAVVEHSSESPYDYVYPIRVTENATIIIHGECKLTSTGFVALALDGYASKNVTIQGDGSLYLSSRYHGIFLVCTRLTIKDITLETANDIANNGNGVLVALTFDHVYADITGGISRIGEGITFKNCAITYPEDAYIAHEQYEDTDYGYYIAYGDNNFANHIIISRAGGNTSGDVNEDGEVNIADINALIDAILRDIHEMQFDVNNDGEINIADVNILIDMILNPKTEPGYVDLGLPSGTLWATCNVGASSPEEFGDYFAWGETAPKDIYTWGTYKWCDGSEFLLLKYSTNSFYVYNDFVDNKTELEPEDDAAYVNWGPSWRMPTMEQQDELRKKCTWTWTTRNGVNGRLVTGPNGNTLFFPPAGYRWGDSLYDAGSWGYYWSRTIYSNIPRHAYYLAYGSSYPCWNDHLRCCGSTVRAVRVSPDCDIVSNH